MASAGVVGKHQLERALYEEHRDISAGKLKEENPLDDSPEFRRFCEACRRGDLKVCQEQIGKGININARDEFDYTPLILASLCGHYEVVQTLLEQGALCERDTFQGERCLYNALNDRIRNLLLSYDYSKSTDPLQPLASHITALLARDTPKTADITVQTTRSTVQLHKFLLSARSPYFAHKLSAAPETALWRLSSSVLPQSFDACIRYLYMGEVSADLGDGAEAQEILTGIDKLSRLLEVQQIFEDLLASGDRRQARQRRTEEIERGRQQLSMWLEQNVLQNRICIESEKAAGVKWDRDNAIFADVLLQAEENDARDDKCVGVLENGVPVPAGDGSSSGIPVGHFQEHGSPSMLQQQRPRRSVLFPCHRAMLIRSELFATMFASPFREGQEGKHLQIIPVDCSPAVLEVVLRFLYTETTDIPLAIALDVLSAADMLFIDKLKQRAALIISTLGNGGASVVESNNPRGETDSADIIDIYEVVRAGWDTRVHRLEEFGARYIAYRLERFIDEDEFKDLVKESAARIQRRQETDTVELIDDIRWYLSERFRLRFEDAGLDEMMDEDSSYESASGIEQTNSTKAGDVDEHPVSSSANPIAPESEHFPTQGVIRTLDGDIAGDEFSQDAMNYQILLGKIDHLMETIGLDG